MNLKTLLKSVLMTAVLLGMMSVASFAQIYVSNTNGDDLVGQGTAVSPYKTITKAIGVVASGGTISIAADTYGESLTITKPMTLVSTTYNGLSTVTVSDITINTAAAADVVVIGGAGSEKFSAQNLNLTKGNLQILSANLTLQSGFTITRQAGTIDNTPTTTNINVAYGTVGTALAADMTTGAELPATLGSGSLTVYAGTKTLTVGNSVTVGGGVTVASGNVAFSNNLTLNDCAIVNNGTLVVVVNGATQWNMTASIANPAKNTTTGELKFAGAVNFAVTKSTDPGGNLTGTLWNAGAGKLTFVQGFTTTKKNYGAAPGTDRFAKISAQNDVASSTVTFGGAATLADITNSGTGTVVVTGGTIDGTVANNAGGNLEFAANTTYSGLTFGNTGIVKLNGNTLTFSGAGATLTNTGKFISTTAATIGAGVLAFTANATVAGLGVEYPNITLAASKILTMAGGNSVGNVYGSITNNGTMTLIGTKIFGSVTNTGTFNNSVPAIAGSVTSSGTFNNNVVATVDGDLTSTGPLALAANLTLKGNYAQNGAGTLTFGANTFEVQGNWARTSNVPGDVTPGTGKLKFTGGNAQTFTPGASLALYDVDVTKTAGTVVTLAASVIVNHDFAINTGKVELGDYNIRMALAGGTFTNNSSYVSTSTNGYIIFEAAGNITGTGKFSNLDIRGGNVTAGSSLIFSGNLILRNGTLVLGANNLTYTKDLVAIPSVTRHIATGSMTVTTGTISCAAGVVYDLKYIGDASGTATAAEWLSTGINDLTIATGDATASPVTARTVQTPGADFSIAGTLTVNEGQTLNLTDGKTITLTSDNKIHNIVGKVVGVDLTPLTTAIVKVTGDNVKINGSTSTNATAYAELPNVKISIGAAKSFESNYIKSITGDLTVDNGTATVNMNTKSANITDDVTLTAGTLTLNMNSTASTHGGDLVLTAGTMNYTRKVSETATGANQMIGGVVTLTDGTLNLGSSVDVVGKTSIVKGNLVLGAYNYTQMGQAATNTIDRTDAGTITGTGKVIFDGAALNTVASTTAFTIPNVEVKGAGHTTFANAVTVSGVFTHTAGNLTLTAPLTISGTAYDYKAGAGTITGEVKFTGTGTLTAYKDITVPTLTVNTPGTFTFASDDNDATPTPRTLTVNAAFTQTAGDIATGMNTIAVTGTFTRAAGAWSQTTGVLSLNTANPAVGDGFAIDNLTMAGAGNFGTKAFTVNKNLVLAAGALTTSADGKLTLGDGVTVERQTATATLVKKPTFAANTNVKYTTLGAITTDNELPVTVKDLTIGVDVTLNAPVTVNGVLSLVGALTNAAAKNVTMAAGSTVSMDGGSLAIAVVPGGAYNLVYNTPLTVNVKEWPLVSTISKITFNKAVNLDQNRTVAGSVGFDATLGSVDLKTFDLNLQGDLLETKTSGFFTNGNLNFTGANAQKLQLNASRTVASDLKITVNKTNATDKVTLVGGNLNFAGVLGVGAVDLTLTKGLLVTGTNVVILNQSKNLATNQPTQGFARTNGSVVGNVQKFIDKTDLIKISRVEYPTGTANGEYRPMAMYFKTAPANSVNLTVNHVNAKAGGNNGFPITAGTKQITNYPDFFWYVKSDIALAPSYQYDMDAMAEGYTDYTKDQIQNVRFVRRDSGSVANQWVMQGADNAYDNSTVSLTKPVVKVIDAMGGITSQGSIFSYSQSNKAPVFTAALTNVIKNEGDTLSGTFTTVDPDFNQTATLSAVTLPAGASFDAATGKVNWIINYDVATKNTPSVAKTITIRSTDNMGAYRDTTVTVTVNNKNRLPVVVKMGAKNVAENVAYEYQYSATDADGETVSYSLNVTGDATLDSAKISTTGKLTWTPGFGNAGKVALLNVNVTDGIGTTTVVDTITVTKTNRAPVFTAKVDTATIPMGSAFTATFTATDPDANTLVYSVTGDDTTATINASTGVFSWTPAYKVAGGVYNFTVKATDNGSPALSVTTPLKLTVTLVNAAPVFTATLNADTVAVGDTLKFQYKATDANGDALTFALVNAPLGASINASTGLLTWIPQASQTAIYVIKATVTDGKITTPVVTSKEVLVKVVTVAVSGKVTYDGSTKGVPGVEVTLTPTTGTAVKATTDASGNYTINNVSAGTYTVKASKTTGWGGVTAGDALLAALNGLDATANPLSAAQKLAADVNGNSTVNAVDAGLIVSKYVDNNTAFAVANWLFVTDASVTVGAKAVTSNITAIAAGDVNRSLANGTIAKNAPSVSTSEEQKIAPKASFTLPIKVAEDAKLGSASIQFTYPVDLVKFEGVIGATGMVSNDVNGTVTIAWFDTKGMNLKAGEVLAGLKFTATEKFAKGQSFTVSVDNSSEITDVKGQPVSLALSVANVTVAVPQAFALNQNYPNPFNPTTTISYDLPVDGKVTLSIYNSIGELVTTLVNSVQTAGSYKYNWNAASMSSGVYLYRITVEGQKAYSSTQKMVLMK